MDKKVDEKSLPPLEELNCSVVSYNSKTRHLKFKKKIPIPFDKPYLGGLRETLKKHFTKVEKFLEKFKGKPMTQNKKEEYEQICQLIYKDIYQILKAEIADTIEKALYNYSPSKEEIGAENIERHKSNSKEEYSIEDSEDKEEFCKHFLSLINGKDKGFWENFIQTQLFSVYADSLEDTFTESIDEFS